MTTATKLNRGQVGGQALTREYGREHMRIIGRMGGRPRALTVKDIIPEAASANNATGRGQRHGKSLEELRRLWRERQAVSDTMGVLGAACLFNSGERSSLEDSRHLGVGELEHSPKNYLLPIIPPSNPILHTTITHFNTDPSPREGGEK